MRRFVISLTIASFLVTGVLFSVSALDDPSTGSARLHQVDHSGITARIVFLDTGDPTTGLIVSGTAVGLDQEDEYISLIYDDGSVPGGPRACEPPPNNDLDDAEMFVGTWEVAADGTGRLNAVKTGASYVPLSDIGTVSVREVVEVGLPELEACGRVSRNP